MASQIRLQFHDIHSFHVSCGGGWIAVSSTIENTMHLMRPIRIDAGRCTILASDYHCPSMLAAVGMSGSGRGRALEHARRLIRVRRFP